MQVAKNEASQPLESPDGSHVFFNRHEQLWRVKTDGTAEEKVEWMAALVEGSQAWSPFGFGIYFIDWNKPKPEVDFFDLTSKKVRTILVPEKYPADSSGSLPVSSDGKWLLFSQVDAQSSNLMMIENWN